MKIVVAYIAVANGPETSNFCARFVGSWKVNPPGVETELIVVCNGGPLDYETSVMFSGSDAKFFPRQNDDGFDIHGYQDVARKFPCDILVCLGESVYTWKQNWLLPVVEAWKRYGPGMYGFLASFLVRPHLNTTAFCVAPQFLLGWPTVTNHTSRYSFEHGQYAFWNQMQKFRKPTKLVTWDGVYDPPQWRYPKNILWRGDQSNCLIRCNHMDRYDAAEPTTKTQWSYAADHGGPKRK